MPTFETFQSGHFLHHIFRNLHILPWPSDYPVPINSLELICPDNIVARHVDAADQLYPKSDFWLYSAALLLLAMIFITLGQKPECCFPYADPA